MRRRTFITALAATPFLTARAFAQTYATPLSYDPRGRPLADVTLNGQGPFPLVIDTAAGGTVLSPELIARLGLSSGGRRARLQGASGATDVELYTLDQVEIAGLRRTNQMAVQRPPDSASSSGHDGVLGARTFDGARLQFDFAANQLRIDSNAGRAPPANPLDTNFRHGIFAHVPISIAGVAATAVVDTGARRSVANRALRQALGFTESDARLREVEPIGGATAHTTPTVAGDATPVLLGGHDYGALELAFADISVFGALQLTGAPALILGLDILRRAQSLTLDYTSQQVAILA